MGFKIQMNSEEIGIPLERNSNNHDILIQVATIYKGGKEIRHYYTRGEKNVS